MYELEKIKKRETSKAVQDGEKLKNDERDQRAEEERKKKQEALAELKLLIEKQNEENGGEVIDVNMDIDNMPDCRLKYKIILARAK